MIWLFVFAICAGIFLVGVSFEVDGIGEGIIAMVAGVILVMTGVIGMVAAIDEKYDRRHCVETVPAVTGMKTRYVDGSCFVTLPDGKTLPYEVWAGDDD